MPFETFDTNLDKTPKTSENIREIRPYELDFILKSKKSELAKMYLYGNENWKPIYTLMLNGKARRSLSKIIKGSEHYYIVGYCFVGDELRVRFFWRSNSEGCRRAGLGEDPMGYGTISKGQNIKNATYETTTKIDYKISKELDKINLIVKANSYSHPIFSLPISGRKIGKFLTPQMAKEIKIDKFYEKYPFSSSCEIFIGQNADFIKDKYKNIKLNGVNLESMKPVENGIYSYKHKFLGMIDVYICEIDWNGTPINIHFSRARSNFPEKIWIDNVAYPGAKINSFGTYDRQINAAPLTAKPIEYASQSPKDMTIGHKVFGGYVDIRDLYQENPLIRRFKEVSGIKQ